MLRKGVYPYEYMNIEKRFNKKAFYSSVNMEEFTDAGQKHAKRLRKDFKITKSRPVSCFVSSKQYAITCRFV